MPPLHALDWWPAVAALAASLVLTPLVRALARRYGAVAHPRGDRWHKQPTALLGGVAIFASVAGVCLVMVPWTPELLAVLGAAAFLWLVGLADDFLHLKPYQKLIAQIMAAAAVAYAGLRLPWTASPPLDIGLTLLWLVGIANAVNLLDNMDGLAAGVVGIASVFLGAVFLDNGQVAEAQILTVFAAALLGFLVYNSNPASIFMGDCGSMFIGFFLAGIALLHGSAGRSRSLVPVLAVPVLVLAIPIFDTMLVTILRKLAGRPASQGGRDHTSHRLVALGLSERRAVWLLYVLAGLAGVLAFSVRTLQLDISLALIGVFSLALVFLGIYLARVKVYDERDPATARVQPLVAFLVDVSYKRRIFEVFLDSALIILAYYLAQTLPFGSLWDNGTWQQFVSAIPVLVAVKLGVFLAVGVYRGLWHYVRVEDLILYAKAVAISSAGSVLAVLFLFRFEGFSRVVFVLDGLLLLFLMCGSRLGFRSLRHRLPPAGGDAAQPRRVLIYGAGGGGTLLERELRGRSSLQLVAVAFADDDPRKIGTTIQGLPVFSGNGELVNVCRSLRVDAVVIASEGFDDQRVREIRSDCTRAGVELKRLRLQLEAVPDDPNRAQELNGIDGPA
jgi:UDP-GlcNAc:undecaprenyl-phosphate GlcNAc-1-phosphate transferase